MDIKLTPDATLPDNTLLVAQDLDDDLLSIMKESHFDVVIDDRQDDMAIRLSPTLLDRIMEWSTLQRVTRRTR